MKSTLKIFVVCIISQKKIYAFFFQICVGEYSNPSVDSNSYLLPINLQSDQVACGVISNEMKSEVIGIKQAIHYDTWTQVENIYNGFNCVSMNETQSALWNVLSKILKSCASILLAKIQKCIITCFVVAYTCYLLWMKTIWKCFRQHLFFYKQ